MLSNRKILIDNSTLSGVERITGASQTKNLSNIGNDILCLEKLVTAILFSDELICIDDYKDTFRANRLKKFDFVNFLNVDKENYNRISIESANFARGMTFSFENSKPSGDVVSFFESLRVDPQLRWDIFSSSEYLALTYLVTNFESDHERFIDSVFRNEVTDSGLVTSEAKPVPVVNVDQRQDITQIKDLVHAFSSSNPQYAGLDYRGALDRMIFGYGWAAERSYFYNAIASIKGVDVSLAPLRDAFCESCLRIDYPSQAAGLIENIKKKSQETLLSILEPTGQSKFIIKLPFFTAYLISKTNNPRECIDLALSMRNNKDFQDCRIIFHNLDYLSALDRIQEMNGIFKYLDESCAKLMQKYAVSTGNGVPFSLSLGLTGVNLGTTIKLDQLFRSYKNKSFSRIFRNIAQDMLNIERLGGLYDKLCSSVREHHEASHPGILRTPKYMEHKENEHGRPAKL